MGKNFADRAQNATKDLALTHILLERTVFKRNYPLRLKKADIRLDAETSVFEITPDSILFRCRFVSKAVNVDTEDIVFESDTTFIVEYKKKRRRRFGSKELHAFGLTRAVYNTWPYLREILQNMIVRTGLPSLTLNPIKLENLTQIAESDKKNNGILHLI